MTDDYGSRHTSAYTFSLSANSQRLYSGSLRGTIGPDDTSDEDWFKVNLLKGATYEFRPTGGNDVVDLNDATIRWYQPNGRNYNKSWEWDSDYSTDSYYDGAYSTNPVKSTGDYYLRVDLSGGDLDVGAYTLKVEQLTPGFARATPTPTPVHTNNSSAYTQERATHNYQQLLHNKQQHFNIKQYQQQYKYNDYQQGKRKCSDRQHWHS